MPLLTIWSPKGGSGASVVAAAVAITLARRQPVRVVDLDGDQPAIFGLGAEPVTGLSEWLAIGPAAPTDALDRLAVDAAPGIELLPHGQRASRPLAPEASAEAGAALAVALGDASVLHVCDVGVPDSPAKRAFVEVSGVALVVVRACYLSLRRATRMPFLARASGLLLVDEPDRALRAADVANVLGRPVVARIPVRAAIARAVDAGVLCARVPPPLTRAVGDALAAVGLADGARGAVA